MKNEVKVVMGKYELGRTLGEGGFSTVKFARHVETGRPFAIKILDRHSVLARKFHDQLKREIGSLKQLKHPNIVRLHEVSASQTKIYIVLEYVSRGELYNVIADKGRLSEQEGRRIFQQIIDAVSYCHDKGVYHRDLKPENVLVDAKGNIKITDFGLSAQPQHLGKDGLLHTTCGSPNYVAPEVFLNRGYDGSLSDIWSCGVILYVILTGDLPFDEKNIALLSQKIVRGDLRIPKWLSPEAQNILKRMLDPRPITRLNMAGIKAHEWFRQDYTPTVPFEDEEECTAIRDANVSTREQEEEERISPTEINAFQLIGMSSYLDLSGFFEKEDASERKIRFTSTHSPMELFHKVEVIATAMGFQVLQANGKLKVIQRRKTTVSPRRIPSLLVSAEVFKISPSLYVVELEKSCGDSLLYRKLCGKLSEDLGVCKCQLLHKTQSCPLERELPLCAL
ncbi:CBL-interacting serine/threonine-protein kinase 17 [Rhynchospora pubera]|uniref:non-specific serine/threonine protein kinase n=1 Tax=Rhynchospora pubera TaxID=906938 RepID=A0AAV8CL95_9POAL|nr:CBL-interacting serine/threonine-protein kinase 17 [Rhynchospora pubera]